MVSCCVADLESQYVYIFVSKSLLQLRQRPNQYRHPLQSTTPPNTQAGHHTAHTTVPGTLAPQTFHANAMLSSSCLSWSVPPAPVIKLPLPEAANASRGTMYGLVSTHNGAIVSFCQANGDWRGLAVIVGVGMKVKGTHRSPTAREREKLSVASVERKRPRRRRERDLVRITVLGGCGGEKREMRMGRV